MPANPGIRVNNTGAVGVYLVLGATQTIRAGGGSLPTYLPLGTCDTFPRVAVGNQLVPIVNDIYGDTPFDTYHGGMVGSISMNLNRFNWANLIRLICGDAQASLSTEAVAGQFTIGKHGVLIGRDDATAIGLCLVYNGVAASRPSAAANDSAKIAGRTYHSVGLKTLAITGMGSRAFSVAIELVPAQGIINNQIEMYRDLTAAPTPVGGALALTDFSGFDPFHTGPVGVYSGPAGAYAAIAGTFNPIGHCASFPEVMIKRDLAPVVSDLFGDAPFDYTVGGQSAQIEMNFTRMDQFNLDAAIRGGFASATGKGSMPLGVLGGLSSTQGSSLRLWWPSAARPSASTTLTFPFGHIEADVITQSGSRAYQNAVSFKASSRQNTAGTELVQFSFDNAGGAYSFADFSPT